MLRHPLARMLGAALAMFLALALSFALTEGMLPKHMRIAWPDLVGAFSCALGYWAYVKWVERRDVTELAASRALPESLRGVALGAVLALLSLAPLSLLGAYRIEGVGDAFSLPKQIPDMLLVSVMEEVLMRGVVFRIAEKAWGSGRALLLSTLLFVAGHLPGEISVTGILVTAAASLALTAGYQLTRRLWLPIGMHFAWNYLFSAVFSVPVSGHEANGWLRGTMTGPDWLTGGAYGVEASIGALVVWTGAAALMLRRVHLRGEFVARARRPSAPAPVAG
jgi:membrane protease YdiL (CAAX protease family)